MTPRVEFLDSVEPDQWFVVFHREGTPWPWSWLALGKFKHVSAVAYCSGLKLWLVYDVELGGTRIRLLAHSDRTIATLVSYMRGCTVVMMAKDFTAESPLYARLGFYCVPAIKHLLGVHCGALRPDGLYWALLRKGGRTLNENILATTAARSRAADGAAAGAAIAG